MKFFKTVNDLALAELKTYLEKIETSINADVITIKGPISPELEIPLKNAIESIPDKRETLAIILSTNGGYVQVAEKIVRIIRRNYNNVYFIIPDRAMSAGTILAMSGNKIFMGHDSFLGPIDPQVQKKIGNETKWVAALSYINKYNELVEKSKQDTLSQFEFLIAKEQFDLAELESFKEHIDLTIDLLEEWLSEYKFKNWEDDSGKEKTKAQKKKRAREIAEILNKQTIWHTHSREIPREVLTRVVKLRIDNIEDNTMLTESIAEYWNFFNSLLALNKCDSLIHSIYTS